jgi:hypothetical protein
MPGARKVPPRSTRVAGRTVIVLMGGVTWAEWTALGSSPYPAAPAFRRLLEESALAAAYLPAAQSRLRAADNEDMRDGNLNIARLARGIAGQVEDSAGRQRFLSTALVPQMFGVREVLGFSSLARESGTAAMIYARRSGIAPPDNALLLLGAAQARAMQPPSLQTLSGEQSSAAQTLGDWVHRTGGRTLALGSGDTALIIGRNTTAREWATVAVDNRGVVDHGDVSRTVLARDVTAPFGLRANGKALLEEFDRAAASTSGNPTTFAAIEWGDTRRATQYAPFCAPDIAAAHKMAALRRGDIFLQGLLSRLNDSRDRLFVVCVPQLENEESQWLPVAYWQPVRGGQGALLQSPGRGQSAGPIRMEDIHSTVKVRLFSGVLSAEKQGASLVESGAPQSSTRRLRRLLAFQSGVQRLEAARPKVQSLSAMLISFAFLLTIPALAVGGTRWPSPMRRRGDSTPQNFAAWARWGWMTAMTFPLVLWLVGPVIEATWRTGGFLEGAAAWEARTLLTWGGVACVLALVLSLGRGWFSRDVLHGVRVASLFALLTIVGLWSGGFALPWNALLGSTWGDGARVPDYWALLLISATLLGVARLTRGVDSQREVQPNSEEIVPEARRVLNLRPAAIWMILACGMLALGNWGHNAPAAWVAATAFGTMWFRLWLERAPRGERIRKRRWIFGGIAAFSALLLWQRGGWERFATALDSWWIGWQQGWSQPAWCVAFVVTLVGLALFLTVSRPRLRDYLQSRYSSRAMLAGTLVASLVATALFGPMGLPLLALYTVGGVFFETLSAPDVKTLDG